MGSNVNFRKLCQSEVENFDVTVRTDHDIFGLDITMRNPGSMRRLQSTRYLDRNIQTPRRDSFARSRHVLAQRYSVNKFSGDVMQPIFLFDFVNCKDVWVIQG